MTNVVELRPKEPDDLMVFCPECKCSSFYLKVPARIECCNCGQEIIDDMGFTKNIPEPRDIMDVPLHRVISADIGFRFFLNSHKYMDVAFAVLTSKEGLVATWRACLAEDTTVAARNGFIRSKLKSALKLLLTP